MSDLEVLSLAYQRQADGDVRDLAVIIAEIRADLVSMQPDAPGPTDEIGFKSEKVGGIRKNFKIMGDGSMVEVAQ
ncbi:hypothetical protein [Terasakiella sp.]|uniref:hypothetical protein n=1 Tax=Terasakiella sp. TaxID=2034861 RepID=UPI003AA9C6E5